MNDLLVASAIFFLGVSNICTLITIALLRRRVETLEYLEAHRG
jgi:hypothetical protein